MANMKEKGITLLSSTTSVNLNSVAATTLYTVPTGKTAWITHIVIRDVSADATAAVATFGQVGALTDWALAQPLFHHLNAAQDAILIQPRNFLEGEATWDAGSIVNGAEEAQEITVTGAALGDFCLCSIAVDVADLVLSGQVTVANTVTASLANNTGGAIDLASSTVRARVWKQDQGFVEYTAAEIFQIDVTVAAGVACTATVDVFGYLA